jgi:hypothetical protein
MSSWWCITLSATGELARIKEFQSELRSLFDYVSEAEFLGGMLVLLRHRIGVASAVLRGALQHGHRARVVARATIRCRRIVAIELATCRSGRTGGASGWTILGNLRRRELIGVVAGG